MKINATIQSGRLILNISQHITGIIEVNEIKAQIESYNNLRDIQLNIDEAFVVPSALIEYLVKLSKVDHKNITIESSSAVCQLFKELQLDTIFTLKIR